MEMNLCFLDLPGKEKNGDDSFLWIERKGWVTAMNLQLSFPVIWASLRRFGGTRFSYFPLRMFFCFLHFLGILIIVGEFVFKVFPNSFPAVVRSVCYANELLALVDKFNTFIKLGNACLILPHHDGSLGLVHSGLHLFVMFALLFVSVHLPSS